MADDLDELKQEVEDLRAMTADTNRIIHKMRRGVWWGRLWTIVFWIAIFSVSGAAYYLYAQPYVEKVQQMYAGFQHQASQAKSWESQAQQFFANIFKTPTMTAPQVQ